MRHQAATALASTRANVDDVIGSANGVLVVLDHHQGVALLAEFVQGVQQNLVVARMQANRGLIQHIAHPLQIAAQLGGQANALGLAARQGRRATVQREVAQTHLFEKLKSALDFWHQITRNFSIATRQAQLFNPMPHLGHRQTGNVRDAPALSRRSAKAHCASRGVQACALASGTRHIGQVFDFWLGKRLLAPFVLVVLHRVVKHFAFVFAQLDARAHAIRAPAMLAVVGEQARVEFGIRGGALWACAQG